MILFSPPLSFLLSFPFLLPSMAVTLGTGVGAAVDVKAELPGPLGGRGGGVSGEKRRRQTQSGRSRRTDSKTEPFATRGVGLPRLPDLGSALCQPQCWFHSSSVV